MQKYSYPLGSLRKIYLTDQTCFIGICYKIKKDTFYFLSETGEIKIYRLDELKTSASYRKTNVELQKILFDIVEYLYRRDDIDYPDHFKTELKEYFKDKISVSL